MNVSRSTQIAPACGERIDHDAMMIGLVSMSRNRMRGALSKHHLFVVSYNAARNAKNIRAAQPRARQMEKVMPSAI